MGGVGARWALYFGVVQAVWIRFLTCVGFWRCVVGGLVCCYCW